MSRAVRRRNLAFESLPRLFVLAIKREPPILRAANHRALGVPGNRSAVMIQRLARIEALEFERLVPREADADAAALRIDGENGS